MIRASSEKVISRSRHGGSMRATLSCASLASSGLFTGTLMSRRSRSASLSPTPKSTNHGRSYSPRRFASRHVPTAAEELAAQSHFLDPMIIKRFDGLMKHLKRNTDKQDFEKHVLASPPDVLVPEEYDEVLRGEFARHCSYGERLNTELMHSGKWVKMLKELGFIPGRASDRANAAKGPCLSSLAAADIIFQRVLHDTDYGGKKLTYDFFCKALCLVAADVYPDLDWESAMGELLNRMASAAEDVEIVHDEPGDFSLDANVLLVLEHFKPKLHNLFRSFARRQLRGPTDARVGQGTTRLKERTIWKQTQDTIFASRASRASRASSMFGATLKDEAPDEDEVEDALSPGALPAVSEGPEGEDHSQGTHPEAEAPLPNQVVSPVSVKTPKATTLLPSNAIGNPGMEGSIGFEVDQKGRSITSPPGQSLMAWAENLGYFNAQGSPGSNLSMGMSRNRSFRNDQWSPVANDPYTYACGSPTLKNRRKFMSLDQLFSLCKELKIMPETISRQAVVRIFKRAQCAGSQSQHAGSNFGYLTQEDFVDAIGRIGIQAYSEAPYCDEYPEAHEKIHAFLCDRLPGVRNMRDRFLYGCSGRGPTVAPGYLGR